MTPIFDPAVCGYTLAYCGYDIDVGTPLSILEPNGNFESIQHFKNFPPAATARFNMGPPDYYSWFRTT